MEDSEAHRELPAPPVFSDDKFEEFSTTGEWGEFFFEWFKYVGQLAAILCCIRYESPAFKKLDRLRYAVCIGLLHRIVRLMHAHLHLSHEGQFGDATQILDRCLHETSVNVVWLCISDNDDHVQRFIADALRADVELRGIINRNIEERGHRIEIERRMLESISRCFEQANMEESSLATTKALPSLYDRMAQAGFTRDRYVIVQRMGSHSVHGTWTTLLRSHLTEENGNLSIRGDEVQPHANQFMFGSLMVLEALSAFAVLFFDEAGGTAFAELFESIRKEIAQRNRESAEPSLRSA